jgi:hypothetical protein
MNEFQNISFDQATSLLRRSAGREVTLVTPSVPGVSIQLSGQLVVQDGGEHFAFGIAASESLSVSVLPFPHCTYQIPTGETDVSALICAMVESDQEMMLWLLRFE